MRDVDEGHAQLLVQRLQLVLHVLAQLLVQRAERLVHQHQLGFEHQRARQGDALLLAAGELRGIALGEALHAHHLQGMVDTLGALGGGKLAHGERVLDVLRDREVREQRVVLEHHADVALVRRHGVEQGTFEADLAAGRKLEAGQHHQAGRLAGAGRAEQRQELALIDVQVQVLDHQGLAVVGLAHTAKADDHVVGLHHFLPPFLARAGTGSIALGCRIVDGI